MIRKYIPALVCTAAALVCGCQKEEQSPATAGHTVTLRANAVSTRNAFDADGNIYWLPGDAIGVTTTGAQTLSELTLSSSGYSQKGNFTGDITGTMGDYAIYPYSENHKIDGTKLTFNLPDTYKYSSVDQNYYTTETTAYNNSANIPGYGTIIKNDDGTFSTTFNHLGGVLCIKVNNLPVGNGYVTLTADRKITGDFTVDLGQGTPELTSTAASSTENTITINYHSTDTKGDGVFFFPMPVGDYNVTVEVGYTEPMQGTKMAHITKSHEVKITRCLIKEISMSYSSMAQNGYYIIHGYKFVDLGLPSGLLWADRNVGATDYYEYGGYWKWDDLSSVVALWDSDFSVPTADQANELIYNNCTLTDVYRDGKRGMLVTSKKEKEGNTNSIFFPYAGSYKNGNQASTPGAEGCYWTSTPYAENDSQAWQYICGAYNEVFDALVNDRGVKEKSQSVRLVTTKQ